MYRLVKQEPPESSHTDLPATPKSDQSEKQMNDNETSFDKDFIEPENKKFILDPTPAQLGRAPFQRRQNMG